MLRAINFMSRAEAELNAGRAVEALVLEREALKALERAFDRRRYFLRTLPELGYEPVVVPKASVEERAAFVLART